MSHPTDQELAEKLRRLDAALAEKQLPTARGGPREAKASEFMWMGAFPGEDRFKHADSRNYLILHADGSITIPATGEPFYMGTFDPTPFYPSA